MNNETFKLIRYYSKLTQRDFAEQIGVSKTTVSLIESGQRRVTPATVAKLARFYELNDAFLSYLDNYRMIIHFNSSTKQ